MTHNMSDYCPSVEITTLEISAKSLFFVVQLFSTKEIINHSGVSIKVTVKMSDRCLCDKKPIGNFLELSVWCRHFSRRNCSLQIKRLINAFAVSKWHMMWVNTVRQVSGNLLELSVQLLLSVAQFVSTKKTLDNSICGLNNTSNVSDYRL
jgi:hypothetical protein